MITIRTALSVAGVCVAVSSAWAGPCTEQIAQLEKTITARHEGAGPAITGSTQAPTTTGSTAAQPSGSAGTSASTAPSGAPGQAGGGQSAQAPQENRAMVLLNQAKTLDQQGKEAECMQITTQVQGMAPATTK